MINESILQNGEKITFALRSLYSEKGYKLYRMSKFEEYDLYAQNKDFLVSDNVITFTGAGGRLMALKPDVTLSIIKNTKDEKGRINKLFYNENVYRVSKATGSFKEIMQSGLECIGDIGENEICEVIMLACESLKMLSNGGIIALSDLDIIAEIVNGISLSGEERQKLYEAINQKNIAEINFLCKNAESENVKMLEEILSLHGTASEIYPKIKNITDGKIVSGEFCNIVEKLIDSRYADSIYIDFSVTDDINYYNGIVFKGFLSDIPVPVISGGRYDRLMKKMGRSSGAVGFAVYTDELDRSNIADSGAKEDDGYLNIALPKGRLGERVYSMFAGAGFPCPSILEQNRKLIFENPEKKLRYFWVKPSDVAIYVERGAADIGVAGKDILLEYEPDIYELLDLGIGKCRMAVAAPKDFDDDGKGTLRVATKFTNIARCHYASKGRDIDIIHLNGSIEIAPILKLSDVIVDIVETGTTLKENNLEVKETVVPISARFIANKTAYKFKNRVISEIVSGLKAITEGNEF